MDPLNLNVDISTHDASRPVLPAGNYEGVIKSASVVPSKKPGNFNIKVEVATVNEEVSTKGTTFKPGYTIARWYPLQASEKQVELGLEDAWKDGIVQLVDGVFGTKQGERPQVTQELLTQMAGKSVIFGVQVRHDDTYGDGNDLGRIIGQ